jgi:hypothetical protein
VIVSVGIGVLLAVVVATRPRTALWAGLLFPVVQAFYSPPLLRLVVLAVMLAGLAMGWRHASPRQRDVVVLLASGIALTVVIGWPLAVEPELAQGVVMNLIYSAVLASLAVVFWMSGFEWCAYLMALGVWVSRWLMTHNVVVTGRAGDLYMGENANGLGVIAAFGMVAAVTLAFGGSQRLPLRFVAALAALVCALGVVASGSRGAFITGASGLAAFAFIALRGRSIFRAMGALLLLVIGLASGAGRGLEWYLERSGRDISAGASLEGRKEVLRQGLQVGLDNLLSGIGFGGLERVAIGISAHNTYVGLFAATGVVPALLLLLATVSAIRRSTQSRERHVLPLLIAVLVSGISLDWIPTARLGPIAFGLLACAGSIRNACREAETTPRAPGGNLVVPTSQGEDAGSLGSEAHRSRSARRTRGRSIVDGH